MRAHSSTPPHFPQHLGHVSWPNIRVSNLRNWRDIAVSVYPVICGVHSCYKELTYTR